MKGCCVEEKKKEREGEIQTMESRDPHLDTRGVAAQRMQRDALFSPRKANSSYKCVQSSSEIEVNDILQLVVFVMI